MCGSVFVSDGGSRVSIAGGGAAPLGVHGGHGDGGRRKRVREEHRRTDRRLLSRNDCGPAASRGARTR